MMEKINRYFYGSEHGDRFQILRRCEPSLGSACDVVFKATDEATREEVESAVRALNDKIGWKYYEERKGERRVSRLGRFMSGLSVVDQRKPWQSVTNPGLTVEERREYMDMLNRVEQRTCERRVRRGGSKHDRKA